MERGEGERHLFAAFRVIFGKSGLLLLAAFPPSLERDADET